MIEFDFRFNCEKKLMMDMNVSGRAQKWSRIAVLMFALVGCQFLLGCATSPDNSENKSENGPPTAADFSSVQQKLTDIQQNLNEQVADLTQENAKLKEENSNLKTEALAAERTACFATRKDEMLPELTEAFKTNTPAQLMQIYGFSGIILGYDVVDVAYKTNTMFITQELQWKKEDGNGEIAYIVTGIDINNSEVTYQDLAQTTPLKADNQATSSSDVPVSEQSAIIPSETSATSPSVWRVNNQTVNTIYQSGTQLLTGALLIWLSSGSTADSGGN